MIRNVFWQKYKRMVRRRAAEAEARIRLKRIFRGTHYVDIMIRRNGKWERNQGDFLKAFIR